MYFTQFSIAHVSKTNIGVSVSITADTLSTSASFCYWLLCNICYLFTYQWKYYGCILLTIRISLSVDMCQPWQQLVLCSLGKVNRYPHSYSSGTSDSDVKNLTISSKRIDSWVRKSLYIFLRWIHSSMLIASSLQCLLLLRFKQLFALQNVNQSSYKREKRNVAANYSNKQEKNSWLSLPDSPFLSDDV